MRRDLQSHGSLTWCVRVTIRVLLICNVLLVSLCLCSTETTSVSEDTELAQLMQHLDTNDVIEDEPGFLRQIRKYSRRLWHINCSARRRRLCHCYSRQLREHFCCDCESGPCFPGSSLVSTPHGAVPMINLTVGQLVFAGDVSGGHVITSRVLGFLDKRPQEEAVYTTLQTRSGRDVTLSGNHLIFTIMQENRTTSSTMEQALLEPIAASRVRRGHVLLTLPANVSSVRAHLRHDPVVAVRHALNIGAYVPLTEHGTLVVDGALASCYASFPHNVAHWALTPARLAPSLLLDTEYSQHKHGVRLFPSLLKYLGRALFPPDIDDPLQRVLRFDLRPFE